MKKFFVTLLTIACCNTLIFCRETVANNRLSEAEKEGIIKKAGNLKLPWIENSGRHDSVVAYYTGIPGGNVYVTKRGEIVYHTVYKSVSQEDSKSYLPAHGTLKKEDKINIHGCVWRENFVNGEVNAIKAEYVAPSLVSYFTGNDPSKWERGKATHYSISLGEVWKYIEVKLNKSGNSIEKRFYIFPGGDANDISMQVTGCEKLAVGNHGALVTSDKPITESEQMCFTNPVAYQYIGDKKVSVHVRYVVKGNTYRFEVGEYNPGYTLVIDPLLSTLSASTLIGGSYYDYSNSVTLDAAGNVYIASATLSTDYPTTTGAYQTTYAGNEDAYVSELSSDLSTLIASTYLGGSENEQAMFVTVAKSGEIFVTGQTFSSDYPTTPGAYQRTFGGGYFDDFIAKFNPGLTNLLASSYLGGSGSDLAYSIVFDNTGNLYLAGFTGSPDFPTTSGAYSTILQGTSNAFITKMDSGLSQVLISTFIGGSSNDYAYSIARDASGNLYISGQVTSSNYPTAGTPYQPALNGPSDTYVSKMNSTLTTLLASTYFGGSGGEQTNNLILDKNNNVYLTGWESSTDFPVTSGAYQTAYGGGQNDAYVSCLDSNLTKLLASTYLGGNTDDYGYGLAVDASGTIYVSGFTGGASESSDFPTTAGAYQQTFGGGYYDAFVSILNNSVTTLQESTFIGGSSSDFGYYLALSPTGNLYINGQTQGADYPTTPGAYQTASAGAADVFISKFGNASVSSPPVALFNANDTVVCPGDQVIYTDESTGAPTSWQWTFTNGTPPGSVSQNPSVTYSETGDYNVKLVVSNQAGADSITKSIHITVNPLPVPGNITGPVAVCEGDSAQLSDTGNTGSIQWQSSSNGISFASMTGDTSSTINTHAVALTTYYRVEATGSCGTDSSAAFKLLVNQAPIPVITAVDSIICSNDSTQVCTSNNFAAYSWNTGDSVKCATVKQAGNYYVTVTDNNGCTAQSKPIAISVYPVPSVSIIQNADTLSSFGQISYQWLLNGNPVNNATASVFIAKEQGFYSVEVTDSDGCTAISTPVNVTVTSVTDLADQHISLYPNPSTGVWQLVVGGELLGSRVEVIDEQGQIVFQSEIRSPKSEISLNVAKGVYWLQISNEQVSLVKKMVKE